MNEKNPRFVYYTISPKEQLFKQLSGLLFFLQYTKTRGMSLILPRFELKGKKYPYNYIFDPVELKKEFNVIDFNEFQDKSKSDFSLNQQTEAWIDGYWQMPYNTTDYMN